MKLSIIIILLGLFFLTVAISCESETVSKDDCGEEIIRSNTEEPFTSKGDTLKDVQTDSSKTTDTIDTLHQSVNKTVPQKKISIDKDSVINVEDALNVPALTDPMKDPDYIGTPCKEIDGECIRHDHDK